MPNNELPEDENPSETNESVFNLDEISDNALHAVPVLLEVPLPEGDEDDRAPIEIDDNVNVSSGRLDLTALFGEFDRARGRQKPREEAPAQNADQTAEIDRLQAALETERNNLRRAQADIINNRRKAQQERERAVQDASDRLIKQLLPIIDDFERSLSAAAQTHSLDQLMNGVEAILRNCETLLNKQGIEPVAAVGTIFDPDFHEAVSVEETQDHPEDTIVEELRKGYLQDGRLLRPALVKVARAIAAPKAEDAADDDAGAE